MITTIRRHAVWHTVSPFMLSTMLYDTQSPFMLSNYSLWHTVSPFMLYNNIQLMTFNKVDTVIYQPRGSDVHRSQGVDKSVSTEMKSHQLFY
jgi:hypothetical protein